MNLSPGVYDGAAGRTEISVELSKRSALLANLCSLNLCFDDNLKIYDSVILFRDERIGVTLIGPNRITMFT